MQPLIKTRTLVQIRTHAQKVFKKIGLKKMNGLKRKETSDKESPGQVSAHNTGGKGVNGLDIDDVDVSGSVVLLYITYLSKCKYANVLYCIAVSMLHYCAMIRFCVM